MGGDGDILKQSKHCGCSIFILCFSFGVCCIPPIFLLSAKTWGWEVPSVLPGVPRIQAASISSLQAVQKVNHLQLILLLFSRQGLMLLMFMASPLWKFFGGSWPREQLLFTILYCSRALMEMASTLLLHALCIYSALRHLLPLSVGLKSTMNVNLALPGPSTWAVTSSINNHLLHSLVEYHGVQCTKIIISNDCIKWLYIKWLLDCPQKLMCTLSFIIMTEVPSMVLVCWPV